MGIALGCIHLSYDDFCKLLPEEYTAIVTAYYTDYDAHYQDNWARMRMLATISIQPHIKNRITPQELLPFPWEEQNKEDSEIPHMSKEQQRQRMRELVAKLDNKENDGK